MMRVAARREEEMLRRHGLEKKRLPKIQKSESKTRAQIFKQSLRISTIATAEEEKDKLKQVGLVEGAVEESESVPAKRKGLFYYCVGWGVFANQFSVRC